VVEASGEGGVPGNILNNAGTTLLFYLFGQNKILDLPVDAVKREPGTAMGTEIKLRRLLIFTMVLGLYHIGGTAFSIRMGLQ